MYSIADKEGRKTDIKGLHQMELLYTNLRLSYPSGEGWFSSEAMRWVADLRAYQNATAFFWAMKILVCLN